LKMGIERRPCFPFAGSKLILYYQNKTKLSSESIVQRDA
jgi:hypothetical protein